MTDFFFRLFVFLLTGNVSLRTVPVRYSVQYTVPHIGTPYEVPPGSNVRYGAVGSTCTSPHIDSDLGTGEIILYGVLAADMVPPCIMPCLFNMAQVITSIYDTLLLQADDVPIMKTAYMEQFVDDEA